MDKETRLLVVPQQLAIIPVAATSAFAHWFFVSDSSTIFFIFFPSSIVHIIKDCENVFLCVSAFSLVYAAGVMLVGGITLSDVLV